MTHWPLHVPARWQLSREQIYAELAESSGAAQTTATEEQQSSVAETVWPRSCYVAMRDGTRLAVDVWSPADSRRQHWPVVVLFTRYWRAQSRRNVRFLGGNAQAAQHWVRCGYVYVVVDVRGSGASFGTRTSEYSEAEIQDYGDLIAWVSQQPWCDGFIATEGGSYSGNAAELATVTSRGLLKATVPRFTDFDSYQSIACPGGIPNLAVLQVWGAMTHALDQVMSDKLTSPHTGEAELPRPMTVDEDLDGTLLNAALREHQNNFNIYDVALHTQHADDQIGGGPSRESTSLYAHKAELELANTPQFAWASWMDAATADGLICRFLTFPDLPIRGLIGSWSHLGLNPGDPYQLQPGMSMGNLVRECANYLEEVRDGAAEVLKREIRYYTMGADLWQSTPVWPPEGLQDTIWFFGPGNTLSIRPVPKEEGIDRYQTSDTSTGNQNRWHTQLGGGAVSYGDRRAADEHLLCYDSEPLDADLEITGHPVVDLHISLERPDATVFVYLEVISPDGTVRHLSEGMLRAAHRLENTGKAPYTAPGPVRRFHRDDLQAIEPGTPVALKFRLLPTSVRLRTNDRIRLAIAGRDADTFACYPDEWPQTIRVHRSHPRASSLLLPMRWLAKAEPETGESLS